MRRSWRMSIDHTGSKVIAIEGRPPKNRVVIMQWESLEQLRAWRESGRYEDARKLGDQYAASVRAFAVGLAVGKWPRKQHAAVTKP